VADVLLVGADGSATGARAADFAAERAREAGARLLVCHVIPWSPYTVTPPEEHEVRHVEKEREIAAAREQIVDPLVELLRAAGVQAEGVIRHGHHTAEVLCEIADEHGAKQIIVGRRGHGRIQRMLFHSTSSNVTQIARVPVTVVP
jgi:nucleotide-binding universal stress UspA family protein